ncbi:MAG: restriction endonuclease [Actinomycetota bacterium]|nr:restriction endonuclease [Actinomycetota bacterium]
MSWREYEERVADFFRQLGWTVEVHADVQGVRTRHEVDVWALSDRFGGFTRWVIECKHWDAKVPKEKVLTLRTIVNDLGADRGFLLNEQGFQSGAYEAAAGSNVTLTTLAELEQAVEKDLLDIRLARVHNRLADLTVRTHRLSVTVTKSRSGATFRARRGVTDSASLTPRIGVVSSAEHAAARARADHFPVGMLDPETEGFVQVEAIEEVIDRGERIIGWMEWWLTDQEAGVTEAGGWDEP